MMFGSNPTPITAPQAETLAVELADMRAEVADLRKRLGNVEALLLMMFGPGALGGSPRPDAPQPEPERRLRPIGTIGGHFVNR